MSQIFHRHTNIYSRLSILAVAVFAAMLGGAVGLLHLSGYNTNQDDFIEQPIQFSHAHHVGGIGIDCRYCHTSVEESAFANIPPTKTCMNCHSQIWNTAPILEPVRASFRDNKPLQWNRVHDLPDFVYFNHSIHVKKGMGCATCHGPRRQDAAHVPAGHPADGSGAWTATAIPSKYIRPREEVYNMSWQPSGRRSRPRRTAGEGLQDRSVEQLTELLDVPQVA